MSDFIRTDIALARGIRAVEATQDQTIAVTGEFLKTMIDARQARGLPVTTGHDLLKRMHRVIGGAIELQAVCIEAHEGFVSLGQAAGLPITSVGDDCQQNPASTRGSLHSLHAVG
ncbi:hypothetical protein PQ455_07515 [Sphingomonas naphthae]|uniref:Uncharacterized protein n=1 Tax=Sphingomonas naphthae TaxID=1813468 RepID=A0ABY7TT58_9SPHN|nr:hypothetical protein [Sphingomonas naphthae]WCT75054.1 hypothetical protein PQ455_07515 [Sphingomonas naphthae]